MQQEQAIQNYLQLVQARKTGQFLSPHEAFKLCNSPGKGLRRNGTLIKGDTYSIKSVLGATGCRWNRTRQAWIAVDHQHAKDIIKAQQLEMANRQVNVNVA